MLLALACTGCTSPLEEHDAHMVRREQQTLQRLSQPSTFAAATQPAAQESVAAPALQPPPVGPVLTLGIREAVLMAMERNRALRVQRNNPEIVRLGEEQARAVFDPTVSGSVSGGPSKGLSAPSGASANAQVALQKFFATGTTVAGTLSNSYGNADLYGDAWNDSARAGLTVTQALLRGAGRRVNLASIRQAQLDTLSSEYELRGFAESLAADVESAYWDYLLAQRQLEIFTSALVVFQQQLQVINDRIAAGTVAESDRAAAEASVALRQQDIIDARSSFEQRRLTLLRLLNADSATEGGAWNTELRLTESPVALAAMDDLAAHLRVTRMYRADLNQARLQINRGDLELIKTKNGLLPRLDLFVTLGKTGYVTAVQDATHWNGAGYDTAVGISGDYALGNRAARATHRAAQLTRANAEESLENLAQIAEQDVRSAYQEVLRAREQIPASAATRRAQETKLQVEQEKFAAGKSTALLVSIAQQDLLSAQNAEVVAVANYLKAAVLLYRVEGTLLERRGILAGAGISPATRPWSPES